jgi:hypothetical protein
MSSARQPGRDAGHLRSTLWMATAFALAAAAAVGCETSEETCFAETLVELYPGNPSLAIHAYEANEHTTLAAVRGVLADMRFKVESESPGAGHLLARGAHEDIHPAVIVAATVLGNATFAPGGGIGLPPKEHEYQIMVLVWRRPSDDATLVRVWLERTTTALLGYTTVNFEHRLNRYDAFFTRLDARLAKPRESDLK